VVINGANHSNDALARQAQADAFTAYTALLGKVPTANLTGQDLGGMMLNPGVYHFNSSAQLTGLLLLNTSGNPTGTFIFQIGSTLTTASNSAVSFFGPTEPNIFWQVGSSATLGTNTQLNGNVVALASITLTTGVSIITGRALAINGAVTMDTNFVNGDGHWKLFYAHPDCNPDSNCCSKSKLRRTDHRSVERDRPREHDSTDLRSFIHL